MTKAVVVLDACAICDLPNIPAINKDLVQRRNFRAVIGRNRIQDQLPKLDINEINQMLLIHLRDHYTTPVQAMSNQVMRKDAVDIKNTVVEMNTTIDQIDVFSLDVLDRLATVDDDGDFARLSKVYSDLLKRRLDGIASLHKVTGKEKADEVKGAMMTSYFEAIAKKLGKDKVSELKRGSKGSKIKDRVEFVTDDFIDVMEAVEDEVTK